MIGFWYTPLVPEEGPVELDISNPVAKAKFIEGEDYWDVHAEVTGFVPKDEKLHWRDIRVTIRSKDGHNLMVNARINQDDPSAYDDGTDGWVDIQSWYICTPSHMPYMTAGSTIKITGLTEESDGGEIKVLHAGVEIGSFTIPPLTV